MRFRTLPSPQQEHRSRGCPPVHILECVRSETNNDVEFSLSQQSLPEFLVSPEEHPTLRRYKRRNTAFQTEVKTAVNETCRQVCFGVWIDPFTVIFQEAILFATAKVRHVGCD